MPHDQASWFGDARALASDAPDARGWQRLWSLAEAALPIFGPEAFPDVALPYLDRMASRWDDPLRLPDDLWHTRALTDPQWALMPLIRALTISSEPHLRDAQRAAAHLTSVVHLTVSDDAALRRLHELPLSAATTHLTIEATQPIPQRVSRAPWIHQITHLTLRAGGYGNTLAIAQPLHLPSLTALNIPASAISSGALDLGPITDLTLVRDLTPALLASLLDHPHASHLTALTLDRPNCSRATLEALVGASRQLPNLQRLQLLHMPLWEQAADGIGRHLDLPALTHLTLHTCHLSDDEVISLATHGTLARLHTLDLRGNRLGVDGITLLREALPGVTLRLDGNWIEDALRGAPHRLTLHNHRLPPEAIASIARLIEPDALEALTLRAVQLGTRDLTPLTSLRLPALTSLDARQNALDARSAAALLDHDRWPALTDLDLSDNSQLALGPFLTRHARLTRLSLRSCRLTGEGLKPLVEALRAGLRPESIDLSDNPLTAEDLTPLTLASPATRLTLDDTLAAAMLDMEHSGERTLAVSHTLLYQLSGHPALLADPRWSTLRRLHIHAAINQTLWPNHLIALLRGAPMPDLIELSIKGGARLSAEEAYRLYAGIPAGLQTLRLASGALTARSAEALLHMLALEQLTTLDVRHNGFGAPDLLRRLGQNKLLPNLRLIQLREGNAFAPDDLRTLERRLPLATII